LLKAYGGSPEIFADMFARHLQHLPLMGKAMAIGVPWLTTLFVHSAPGRRISERTREAFPVGYFMVGEKSAKSARCSQS
jgi:hypothetical protein